MQALTFSFVEQTSSKHVTLVPCEYPMLRRGSWEELAEYIGKEPSLRPCSPEILQERWQRGHAAIAVRDNRIVSFISLVPILTDHTWAQISKELGAAASARPSIDLYGSSTGWTLPEWRNKGISQQLRAPLLERFSNPCWLSIGVTVGFGASALLSRFDWRIAAWSEFPFIGTLAGLPLEGFEGCIGDAWQVPVGMTQYEGEHIPVEQFSTHPWKRYCHLWYSRLPLAAELDAQLARLALRDLRRWRETVLRVFSVWSESPWTLHIFRNWTSVPVEMKIDLKSEAL